MNGKILTLVTIISALALGSLTYQRNLVWQSEEAFWFDVLKKAPNRARAHNNYGVALFEQRRFSDALPSFQKAIELDALYPDPINNAALCYAALGNVDEAIQMLKKSLELNKYVPEVYENLAGLFICKKDFDRAEKCVNNALKLRPHYGKAYVQRGRIYLAQMHEVEENNAARRELLVKARDAFGAACTIADFDHDKQTRAMYEQLCRQCAVS